MAMRSEQLIANEVLAFIQHAIDTMDEVSIIQICKTNFTREEIVSAKILLFESLGMSDRMPSRRKDEKGEKGLQDIINLLKVTDPDDLPAFVAKNIQSCRPSRSTMWIKFRVCKTRHDTCVPRPAPPPAEVSPCVVMSTPQRDYAAAASRQLPGKRKTTRPERESGKPRIEPPRSAVSNHVADKDGFIKVERKKRKPPCRNQCGTAPTGTNHLLRPAVPVTHVYVSRLHHNTKPSDITEYLAVKTKYRLVVEKLEAGNAVNFSSFVVRVPTEHIATFLKEDLWPKGVVFRKNRGRRAPLEMDLINFVCARKTRPLFVELPQNITPYLKMDETQP
ncbi:uncharacterized protein [Epargyreus clarus]|uniref:uncharacterized protein n=1 Tax=Epargyreus clarus TaxID=520877 RepID=UPI003C2DDAD5